MIITMTNKITCSECKKKYKTYIDILSGSIESIAMDQTIRDIYYNEEKNEGLCKECREKLHKDKVKMWRLWLNASASIMIVRSKQKGSNKIKWTKALKRIEEIDKELEKSKEVRKFLQNKKNE